jgi:hypothetical protein
MTERNASMLRLPAVPSSWMNWLLALAAYRPGRGRHRPLQAWLQLVGDDLNDRPAGAYRGWFTGSRGIAGRSLAGRVTALARRSLGGTTCLAALPPCLSAEDARRLPCPEGESPHEVAGHTGSAWPLARAAPRTTQSPVAQFGESPSTTRRRPSRRAGQAQRACARPLPLLESVEAGPRNAPRVLAAEHLTDAPHRLGSFPEASRPAKPP